MQLFKYKIFCLENLKSFFDEDIVGNNAQPTTVPFDLTAVETTIPFEETTEVTLGMETTTETHSK